MKVLRSMVLALLSILMAYNTVAQYGSDQVVFQSPVLLTRSMMEKHSKLVQKLLDLQYDARQKEEHFRLIKAYWQRGDRNGMQLIVSNLQFADQLNALPPDEFNATVTQLRSSLILSLLEDAGKAEDSRWYLQNYLAAHPPLVPGSVPFLKETADALIDCEIFINRELKGKVVKPLTQQQREAAYKELSAQWDKFDIEKKRSIMNGVSKMSLIFYRWKAMGAMERAGIKAQYVGEQYLSASEKDMIRRASIQGSGELRSQQFSLLQNELSYMKRSTDIIMSQGTRWNPATNRYEQIGGIVTEFW